MCAGAGGFSRDESEFIKLNGISGNILQFNVNDNILMNLYKKATAFVYPSLYEGFGIPILESFASNCPVILSNTSSFPEVAGDAGSYFDPFDIDSISDAISSVIYQEKIRQDLIEKGRKRLQQFSWEITAIKTANVYKSI